MEQYLGQQLLENADEYARRFAAARPFRHVQIDEFFSADLAARLGETFPAFDDRLAINENGEVGGKCVHENVRRLGPDWERLDDLVKGADFRGLMSKITGVSNLQYDPHYFGGGTHENRHGQSLDAHVDFNLHPMTRQHRRLNLIVYLAPEWEDEWGGSIRLHRDPYLPPSQDDIVTVTPAFNRAVIFETNEYSWHGFPVIDLPEDKRHLSRKSFALYYYTETRPKSELGPEHSTIYVEEHLPEDWQAGMVLDAGQLQHVRNLVARRDQHLRRLYENIKQLNTDLNHYREQLTLQLPPATDPEPDDAADAEVHEERLQQSLERREAEVRYLQARIEELKSSTSWKLTRPMRKLKRLVAGG